MEVLKKLVKSFFSDAGISLVIGLVAFFSGTFFCRLALRWASGRDLTRIGSKIVATNGNGIVVEAVTPYLTGAFGLVATLFGVVAIVMAVVLFRRAYRGDYS